MAHWLGTAAGLLLSCSLAAQPLRDGLQARLMARGDTIVLPSVQCDSTLPSNARYLRDTIWLGHVQAAFATYDDSLSLIWHEYQHHRLQGQFPVQVDAEGLPVQWMTDEQYLYQAPPAQIARELAQSEAFFADLPLPQREAQLTRLRQDLTQPDSRPFRYAPSNLAREELLAYQAQWQGDIEGLYHLSASARQTIRIRLYQLTQTLALRLDYEQRMGLGPDGNPRP
jgi:hypothetical protein